MMKRKEIIRQNIKEWIDANREKLPLNIDYWDIHISKIEGNKKQQPKLLEFGKYNAKSISTNSFYKSHSRIVKIS